MSAESLIPAPRGEMSPALLGARARDMLQRVRRIRALLLKDVLATQPAADERMGWRVGGLPEQMQDMPTPLFLCNRAFEIAMAAALKATVDQEVAKVIPHTESSDPGSHYVITEPFRGLMARQIAVKTRTQGEYLNLLEPMGPEESDGWYRYYVARKTQVHATSGEHLTYWQTFGIGWDGEFTEFRYQPNGGEMQWPVPASETVHMIRDISQAKVVPINL